jgi:hypothetical protein
MIFVNTIWEICPYKYSFSNTTESYSSPDERLEFVQEPDSFATHTKNKNGTVSSTYNPTVSFTVDVVPKDRDTIMMSHSFGQDYKVIMERVKLEVPFKNNTSSFYHLLPIFIPSIIITIIFIWMLCIGIKIIRNVRRGNVFVTDIANKIEKIGKLYLILCLTGFAVSYATTKYFIHTVHIADYNIVFQIGDYLSDMLINIAVALTFMVVSQVILMGKELKDEQDLTV